MDIQRINKAPLTNRLLAFIIDHIFISSLCLLMMLFVFGTHIEYYDWKKEYYFVIMICFHYVLYVSRDSLGISIGKWFTGIQVIHSPKESAGVRIRTSKRYFLLRNVTMLIWPVEAIYLLFNSNNRRIGDQMASTDVVTISKPYRISSRFTALFFIIWIALLCFYGFEIKYLKDSRPYRAAIDYMNRSLDVHKEVGEIQGYGWFPTGSIENNLNGTLHATFKINVRGEQRSKEAIIRLSKPIHDEIWKVEELTFTNEQ